MLSLDKVCLLASESLRRLPTLTQRYARTQSSSWHLP